MFLFLMAIATLCYERQYSDAQSVAFLIEATIVYLVIDNTAGRMFRRWWKSTPTYKNLVSSMTRVLDTKLW